MAADDLIYRGNATKIAGEERDFYQERATRAAQVTGAVADKLAYEEAAIVAARIADEIRFLPAHGQAAPAMWERFDSGAPLSDEDLDLLIESAKQGLEFLKTRGEQLLRFKVTCDLEALERIKGARAGGQKNV